MSLILKGIDIPKDAAYFKLSFYDGNRENEYGVSGSLKPYITQIPKGHGRLIDADALEIVFKDMAKCEWNQKVSPISWAYAFEDTIDEIDNAPTILEAEES